MHDFQRMVVGVPGSQKEHAPRHVVQEKYGRTGNVNVQNLSMAEKTVMGKKKKSFPCNEYECPGKWEARWW